MAAGRNRQQVSGQVWRSRFTVAVEPKPALEGASDVTDSNKSSAAIAVLFKDSYELSFAVFVSESIKLHL